jgi:hypothetical protein
MSNQGRRQPMQTDEEIADLYPNKRASSARRYTTEETAVVPYQPGQVFTGADGVEYVVIPGKRPGPLPQRASRLKEITTAPESVPLPKQRWTKGRTLACLLSGVAATLLVLWLGMALISWWTNLQADWTYTKAFRTYSVDQAVGHGGDSAQHPSHFIIQNDKGQILIIELPADDPKKAVMIPGPILLGADHEPVTVTFEDTTGSGRLDLILHFQSQTVVFLNTGEKFVQSGS